MIIHAIAFLVGLWSGILFALWAVDMVPDAIGKILNHSPKD